jgi:hypothetical protein
MSLIAIASYFHRQNPTTGLDRPDSFKSLRFFRQRLEDYGLVHRFRSKAQLNQAANQSLPAQAQKCRRPRFVTPRRTHRAEQQLFFNFGQE